MEITKRLTPIEVEPDTGPAYQTFGLAVTVKHNGRTATRREGPQPQGTTLRAGLVKLKALEKAALLELKGTLQAAAVEATELG